MFERKIMEVEIVLQIAGVSAVVAAIVSSGVQYIINDRNRKDELKKVYGEHLMESLKKFIVSQQSFSTSLTRAKVGLIEMEGYSDEELDKIKTEQLYRPFLAIGYNKSDEEINSFVDISTYFDTDDADKRYKRFLDDFSLKINGLKEAYSLTYSKSIEPYWTVHEKREFIKTALNLVNEMHKILDDTTNSFKIPIFQQLGYKLLFTNKSQDH